MRVLDKKKETIAQRILTLLLFMKLTRFIVGWLEVVGPAYVAENDRKWKTKEWQAPHRCQSGQP